MAKKTNKKNQKQTWIIISAAVFILIVVASLTVGRNWIVGNYYRVKIEKTLRNELRPFTAPLNELGFTNLNDIDTKCSYVKYPVAPPADSPHPEGGTFFECRTSVNRFVVMSKDAAKINNNAKQISDLLKANGWNTRKDFPTIDWFKKITEGVDYQPDQYSQKQVGDFNCIFDFFTAFSKPDPAAVAFNASCTKMTKDSQATLDL